jgi:hypothetical protein
MNLHETVNNEDVESRECDCGPEYKRLVKCHRWLWHIQKDLMNIADVIAVSFPIQRIPQATFSQVRDLPRLPYKEPSAGRKLIRPGFVNALVPTIQYDDALSPDRSRYLRPGEQECKSELQRGDGEFFCEIWVW